MFDIAHRQRAMRKLRLQKGRQLPLSVVGMPSETQVTHMQRELLVHRWISGKSELASDRNHYLLPLRIRQFSARYNEPPGLKLRRLRLAHAHAMLSATELSVEDVALASGFTSPNSLGRSYRAMFGHSPRGKR